jgi:hypothetical protein
MPLQGRCNVPGVASGGRIRSNGGCLCMTGRRRSPAPESGRRDGIPAVPNLAHTADPSRGASNLATVPRAGNVSRDTRAGRHG